MNALQLIDRSISKCTNTANVEFYVRAFQVVRNANIYHNAYIFCFVVVGIFDRMHFRPETVETGPD